MSYGYYETLDDEQKHRYRTKLDAAGLDRCPYRLPGDSWVSDPTKWPTLEYPELYEYLTNTPGVHTREAMRNRKALEAMNLFRSGWVRTVLCYNTDKATILRAEVMPSQPTNDPGHNPWVALPRDALVSMAHCDCMAGLGESCSHIAALLFKVEAVVRYGVCDRASTEEPCVWNNDYVKKVAPSPISEINFSTKEKAKSKQRRQPVTPSPISEINFSTMEKAKSKQRRQPVTPSPISEISFSTMEKAKSKQRRQPVTPSPISEINFFKDTTKEKAKTKKRRQQPITWEPATADEQKKFLDDLATCDKPPIGLCLFREYQHLFSYKAPVPNDTKLPH